MNLSPLPIQKFFDNNGRPLTGGLLYTYVAGTTTKIATYTDDTGATQNTNPVVLDYRGEARVWLDPTLSYKFTLSPEGDTDPPTRPIWTVDNIASGITLAALTQQIVGRILWPPTTEETSAGIAITTYAYPPGHWFRYGVIGDGNGSGGGTNDAAAIQASLNLLRDYGVQPIIPRSTYRLDSGVTLQSNTPTAFNYVLDFNGSVLDFSNISGSQIAFTLGAIDQPSALDTEFVYFANVKMTGPETLSASNPANDPSTSTIGLFLDFALKVVLVNVSIQLFYNARFRNFVFPLTTTGFTAHGCYIGDYCDNDNTEFLGLGEEFTSCRYPVLIRPTGATKTVLNQVYIRPRFEQCVVGPVIDQGSGTGIGADGIVFLEPYYEDVDYDYARFGLQWTFANPATRNPDSDRSLYNSHIQMHSLMSGDTWTGTKAPLVLSSNGSVRGGEFVLPANITDVVGTDVQYVDYKSQYGSAGDSSPVPRQLVGPVNARNSLSIGVTGGSPNTPIIAHLTATAVLDFDLTAVAYQDLTIAVPGALPGDTCALGVPGAAMVGDVGFSAPWVSGADTVSVRAFRVAGTPNPGSGTFRVDVWRH